eukprot:TRINITY_DN9005_c0_g1_i8.p1 TRINITY_DN9005_c0_g1~~TRINITY_DN9005_c0_g1_i8.p1  ORF type:complete len:313 (+),score=40.12 TRINITY_DN9005_c0_g1_i8:3-941(+)
MLLVVLQFCCLLVDRFSVLVFLCLGCVSYFCFSFFFFFQAEDGIRDVERSRGLGDVYKRQYQRRVHGIREKALTDWLPKINKRRRGNQISTNYIDAMAIEFLYAYNKHFNEKRSVMIHLSKSGLSHSGVFPYSKSKRWFNLPNLKVQGNSLKHEIPIVYNPIAFYIYLVCKEIGDLPSTIRRLKKLLHLNTRIQHSYQEIKDHIKENLNNGLSRQVQKNLATVDNNKKAFENLRLALLFKDDETLKTINTVSYTHLTLPTILLVQISVVAVSLKKKNKDHKQSKEIKINNNNTIVRDRTVHSAYRIRYSICM